MTETSDTPYEDLEKVRLDVALKTMSDVVQHRFDKIKEKVDLFHQSIGMLHKINEKVNKEMTNLEPLFSVWSRRSSLFQNLDAL